MVPALSQAQTDMSRWSIGLFPSVLQYQNTDGSELFKFKQSSFAGDLGVGYKLNPSFMVEGHFMGGSLDFDNGDENTENLDADIFDLTAKVLYKFNNGYILKEEACLSPFLFAGAGGVYSEAGSGAVIPLGAGLNVRFDELFSMQWRSEYKLATTDVYNYFQHSLGFVFNLGSKSAKKEVSADRDNDGVLDAMDDCPDTAGLESNNGCPEEKVEAPADRDKDGIADAVDNCPDTPGLASTNGCPDSDRDGIIDSKDKCPNASGLPANGGCPDRDKDGIIDSEDKCPDTAGPSSNAGCPDRDQDGISDADDKCPDTPGLVANNGCPDLDEETKEVMEEVLEGIQFETGKDVLKTESYPTLDHVVSLMKKHPEYKISFEGYTDSSGDAAKNLDLSKRRAKRAKDYVISHGIAADRLTSTGYGAASPIADNNTSAGRAKNRRVEIKVSF